MNRVLLAPFLNWARKLKYPSLFKLVAALFVIDLFVPDLVPFIDEILLGLGTLLLANWKKRKDPEPAPKPPLDGEFRR